MQWPWVSRKKYDRVRRQNARIEDAANRLEDRLHHTRKCHEKELHDLLPLIPANRFRCRTFNDTFDGISTISIDIDFDEMQIGVPIRFGTSEIARRVYVDECLNLWVPYVKKQLTAALEACVEEDEADLKVIRERQNEPTISLEELKKELDLEDDDE